MECRRLARGSGMGFGRPAGQSGRKTKFVVVVVATVLSSMRVGRRLWRRPIQEREEREGRNV